MTIRSRSNKEIGQLVEGCKITSKTVVIPPVPAEHRMGVYDYEVEPLVVVSKIRGTVKAAGSNPGSNAGGTRKEVAASFFSRRVTPVK